MQCPQWDTHSYSGYLKISNNFLGNINCRNDGFQSYYYLLSRDLFLCSYFLPRLCDDFLPALFKRNCSEVRLRARTSQTERVSESERDSLLATFELKYLECGTTHSLKRIVSKSTESFIFNNPREFVWILTRHLHVYGIRLTVNILLQQGIDSTRTDRRESVRVYTERACKVSTKWPYSLHRVIFGCWDRFY